MKRLLALMLFALLIPEAAFAQAGALVVATCGTLPKAYPAGSTKPIVVDVNGNLCSAASVSASITGFAPATTGTPISVTTGGNTGTLPSGAVVTVFNTGATNTAFCKLGASATTSDIAIPPASWFAYTVGVATQLTCITSASTTTVNMVGGSGLPTGAGGGGGGSGGAVTIADGADVTLGAKADAAAGTGTVTAMAILKQLHLDATAAIPAGSNVIGSVSVNQTTFGTTNGVVSAANTYQAVAASQTATVLQTSTGATGDYLSHCIIYPTSTSPGVVTVFDNTNTAATSAILFPGGASSTSNLVPIVIAVGAKSTAGAWKVTTGSAVSVVCVGKFS